MLICMRSHLNRCLLQKWSSSFTDFICHFLHMHTLYNPTLQSLWRWYLWASAKVANSILSYLSVNSLKSMRKKHTTPREGTINIEWNRLSPRVVRERIFFIISPICIGILKDLRWIPEPRELRLFFHQAQYFCFKREGNSLTPISRIDTPLKPACHLYFPSENSWFTLRYPRVPYSLCLFHTQLRLFRSSKLRAWNEQMYIRGLPGFPACRLYPCHWSGIPRKKKEKEPKFSTICLWLIWLWASLK